jgi:hypothetical protein
MNGNFAFQTVIPYFREVMQGLQVFHCGYIVGLMVVKSCGGPHLLPTFKPGTTDAAVPDPSDRLPTPAQDAAAIRNLF